jgi:hypothetical protein
MRNLGWFTLAVLVLFLAGSQLTYAGFDNKPPKHKKTPEPATLTLLVVGLGGVGAMLRRRKAS